MSARVWASNAASQRATFNAVRDGSLPSQKIQRPAGCNSSINKEVWGAFIQLSAPSFSSSPTKRPLRSPRSIYILTGAADARSPTDAKGEFRMKPCLRRLPPCAAINNLSFKLTPGNGWALDSASECCIVMHSGLVAIATTPVCRHYGALGKITMQQKRSNNVALIYGKPEHHALKQMMKSSFRAMAIVKIGMVQLAIAGQMSGF
ncbi:hypothetical protein K438DRAFT_1755139 [Mycena galopus ATCC 62051]|nr:hypothetical protein K438DRAFT_1755139 [Mycena galopus ATCC 62051]